MIIREMQVQVAVFEPTSFPSQNLFKLCYTHILNGDDGNFIILYDDKEQGKSGLWCSPQRGEHQYPLPHCSLLLRPSREQRWEHSSTMYTCHDYKTFVQCNIVTLRYYYYVTLKHLNIENYNGQSTHVQFLRRQLLHSMTWPWSTRAFNTSDGNHVRMEGLEGLMRMGMNIHAHGRDAPAWAQGCLVNWDRGWIIWDINSYTWVLRARIAHVQASSTHKEEVSSFFIVYI